MIGQRAHGNLVKEELTMARPLVTDDLWQLIDPLIPKRPPRPKGGRPVPPIYSIRAVDEGLKLPSRYAAFTLPLLICGQINHPLSACAEFLNNSVVGRAGWSEFAAVLAYPCSTLCIPLLVIPQMHNQNGIKLLPVRQIMAKLDFKQTDDPPQATAANPEAPRSVVKRAAAG